MKEYQKLSYHLIEKIKLPSINIKNVIKQIIILLYAGDPVLRHKAPEVPEGLVKTDEIQNLVEQMKSVLHNYNLVGLAAPQIGVSYRVIVMEASEQLKEKYPKEIYDSRQMSILPLTVSFISILNYIN